MFLTWAFLLFGSTIEKREIRHIKSTHLYYLRHEPCTIASAESEEKALELFNYLKNGGTDRAQSLLPPITQEEHTIFGMKCFEGRDTTATLLMHYKNYPDKLPDNFLTILWGISDENIQQDREKIGQKLTRLILLFDTINPQIMNDKIAVLASDNPLNAAITRVYPISNIKPPRSMVMSGVQGTITGGKKVWKMGKSIWYGTTSTMKRSPKEKVQPDSSSPIAEPAPYSDSDEDVDSQNDATNLSENAIHIHFCPKNKHFITGVFSTHDSTNLRATLENPHYTRICMNGSKSKMSPIIYQFFKQRKIPLAVLDLTQTDIDLEYMETLFAVSNDIPQELNCIFENAHQKFTSLPVIDWRLMAQTTVLPQQHWQENCQELFKNALAFIQTETQKIVAQTRDDMAQTKDHISKIQVSWA